MWGKNEVEGSKGKEFWGVGAIFAVGRVSVIVTVMCESKPEGEGMNQS